MQHPYRALERARSPGHSVQLRLRPVEAVLDRGVVQPLEGERPCHARPPARLSIDHVAQYRAPVPWKHLEAMVSSEHARVKAKAHRSSGLVLGDLVPDRAVSASRTHAQGTVEVDGGPAGSWPEHVVLVGEAVEQASDGGRLGVELALVDYVDRPGHCG
jgi:hypothetical protein